MARKAECNRCGNQKEINYINDSLCKKCRSLVNKEKRAKARQEKGLPPIGQGRSVYCSKCKMPKEKGCEQQSYCKGCKEAARKSRLAKKRLLENWQPKRKKTKNCFKCGAEKENLNKSYCNSCLSKKDKEYRLRIGKTKRLRTGKCKCGNEIARYSKCYCRECATKWRKTYLEKNPNVKAKIYQKAAIRNQRPNERFKYHARQMVLYALRSGLLTKQPCVKCGETKVDAHHEDYTRPLDVIWLCRKHHAEIHNSGD